MPQTPAPLTAYRTCDPLHLSLRWSLVVSGATALLSEAGGMAHLLSGGALALCLILRLLWGLVGPPSAALAALWPGVDEIHLQIADLTGGEKRYDLGPSPIGAAMGLVILLTLALLALSGAALALGAGGLAAAVHATGSVALTVAVSAYLAGLIWASLHYRVNLGLALLTGVKPLPEDSYWSDSPAPAATLDARQRVR